MRQVTAAVIVENGRLLLTRRGPGGTLPGCWELPGGKVEPGESLQECLTRELQEELAMEANIAGVVATTTYRYDHGAFEMYALETTRCSDFTLHVHDMFLWATSDEIIDLELAPADIELIGQLGASDCWPRP